MNFQLTSVIFSSAPFVESYAISSVTFAIFQCFGKTVWWVACQNVNTAFWKNFETNAISNPFRGKDPGMNGH